MTRGSKCERLWEPSLATAVTAALHQSLSYELFNMGRTCLDRNQEVDMPIKSNIADGFLLSNLLLLHSEECHNIQPEGDAAAAAAVELEHEPEPPPQLSTHAAHLNLSLRHSKVETRSFAKFEDSQSQRRPLLRLSLSQHSVFNRFLSVEVLSRGF